MNSLAHVDTHMEGEPEIVRVSSKSRTQALAGAIAHMVREGKVVQIQSVGAGAINQAVKGATLARKLLEADGFDFVLVPSFGEIVVNTKETLEERTCIRLLLVVSKTVNYSEGSEL